MMSISKSPSTLFVLFSWILISCATQGRLIAKSGKFSSPALGLLSKASASSEITCTVVGFSESAFLNISQKFSAAIRGDSPRRDVVEAIGEGTENRDFFIFDVSEVQQQFESTLFVAKIQRLLDHSLQHCRPIRLFIFFQDNPAFFATSIYRSIELMVRLANLEYNGENNSLLIDVVYRDISQIDNALDVIANEFMVQDRAVAKLLQEKVLSKTSATFETNPSKISSKSEYAETFENFEILLSSFQRLVDEEFMRIIRNVLEATDANVFVENVKTALLSVNQYHYLQNSHLIDEVVLVSNVKLMADRVRFVLSKSLLMLSREIVRVVHRGGVRNFRLHLRKLSPKANVPWLIQKEIESRLTKQLKLLSDINQGLQAIQNRLFSSEGLLSLSGGRCALFGFDAGYEVGELRKELTTLGARYITQLELDGQYNPHLRTWHFPPTHINLNYQLNPKLILTNLEYGRLYDPHSEHFAFRRAHPLQFRGLSNLPFDPNESPTPKDNPPTIREVVGQLFKSKNS